MKTAGMNAGERLLPIEEMEPWAQSAFKGFKYATSFTRLLMHALSHLPSQVRLVHLHVRAT